MSESLKAIGIAERLALISYFFIPDVARNQFATIGTVLHFKRQIARITLYPLAHLGLLHLAWQLSKDKLAGRLLDHLHAVIFKGCFRGDKAFDHVL